MRLKEHQQGFAWLAVFLPALAYYLHRSIHGPLGRGGTASSSYPIVTSQIHLFCSHHDHNAEKEENSNMPRCDTVISKMESLMYLGKNTSSRPTNIHTDSSTSISLSYPLEAVLEGFESLTGPTWVHDEELGRGYLLFSDAGTNRIWRWEVGGGPITIGRTLHMERSGCRSNRTFCQSHSNHSYSNSNSNSDIVIGSAGMAVEAPNHRLVVCEQGERRIVRIEEDGARTPLATHAPPPPPSPASSSSEEGVGKRRLHGPQHVVYTPLGDLLFTDPNPRTNPNSNDDDEDDDTLPISGIYKVHEAVHLTPTEAKHSRAAHFQPSNASVELWYSRMQKPWGMDLSLDVGHVLVSEGEGDGMVIYKIPIEEEDEGGSGDDEDEDGTSEDEDGSSEDEDTDREAKDKDKDQDNFQKNHETSNQENQTKPQLYKGKMDHLPAASLLFFNASTTPLLSSTTTTTSHYPMRGLRTDAQGNVWATGPGGILLLSPEGQLWGRISTGEEMATDVTFGEDGYVYVTTRTRLLRMKVKVKGWNVPNLVVSKKKKKTVV